jgi:hypothetical protein
MHGRINIKKSLTLFYVAKIQRDWGLSCLSQIRGSKSCFSLSGFHPRHTISLLTGEWFRLNFPNLK